MAVTLRLLPIERVAAAYCLLTTLLIAVLASRLVNPAAMLLMRAGWLAATALLLAMMHFLSRHSSLFTFHSSFGAPRHHSSFFTLHSSFFILLRTTLQLSWLAIWYQDTYEFNRSFDNLDHLFAAADQALFGCQPAITFSQQLPGAFWSEAFNLGYWSYFPMIALLSLTTFYTSFISKNHPSAPTVQGSRSVPHSSLTTTDYTDGTDSSFFILHSSFGAPRHHSSFLTVPPLILLSFFLFYVIYIFLPVAGPQYYFQAVGIDAIQAGHFPSLGTYFSSHTEMLPAPGYAEGLFYNLVHAAQAGERPTAAFPSSHIGISTIVLLLARRHAPRLLPVLIPLWALLCCATVYIQAHYLVDAIAGLLAAPLILWLAKRLLPVGEWWRGAPNEESRFARNEE